MKIPETSANVGAYYGNEENGQWQNGVIMDGGVGGGVVGSGDAQVGMHRPPLYPVHIPRGHPGYVMAGPYYPHQFPAPPQDDFADYMWMENEEEFDKQVMQQLEEEALMEQCIEAMLEDEQRERNARGNAHNTHYPTTSNGGSVSLQEAVSRSKLNPLAAEFVPTRSITDHNHTEEKEKQEPKEAQETTEDKEKRPEDDHTETTDDVNTKTEVLESPSPPKDPPEVSALDINPKITKTNIKKQTDTKKPLKVDPKKAKLPIVKSEPKIKSEIKKKEVKVVKSEVKVEVKSEEVIVEVPKPPTPTPEEPSGPKPINYAAAAKASKPKPKPLSTITTQPEKTTIKQEKPKVDSKIRVDKKIQPKEKSVLKEKVVQRKNSAKSVYDRGYVFNVFD